MSKKSINQMGAITAERFKQRLKEVHASEDITVLELVKADESGNLHFKENVYVKLFN